MRCLAGVRHRALGSREAEDWDVTEGWVTPSAGQGGVKPGCGAEFGVSTDIFMCVKGLPHVPQSRGCPWGVENEVKEQQGHKGDGSCWRGDQHSKPWGDVDVAHPLHLLLCWRQELVNLDLSRDHFTSCIHISSKSSAVMCSCMQLK